MLARRVVGVHLGRREVGGPGPSTPEGSASARWRPPSSCRTCGADEANVSDARSSEHTVEAVEYLGATNGGVRLATGRMRERQLPVLLQSGALPIALELDRQTIIERHAPREPKVGSSNRSGRVTKRPGAVRHLACFRLWPRPGAPHGQRFRATVTDPQPASGERVRGSRCRYCLSERRSFDASAIRRGVRRATGRRLRRCVGAAVKVPDGKPSAVGRILANG